MYICMQIITYESILITQIFYKIATYLQNIFLKIELTQVATLVNAFMDDNYLLILWQLRTIL